MKELFATYPVIAWSLVSALLAVVCITLLWDKVKWWWMNTWYRFPLIGKLSRLARDPSGKDEDGWSYSERTLCHDYLKFMLIHDEHDFNEKKAYLRYATENSRKPMPKLLWVLVCAMVLVEAMGFSYVLAGYTIPGASENLQQTGAYGIAFLISVMLVAFTHWAGHELYSSGKINAARSEKKQTSPKGALYGDKVSLDMPQDSDAGQAGYSRMLNRFEHKEASYKIFITTALLVLAVAVGATYVRGQVLDKQLLQETMNPAANTLLNTAGSGGDALSAAADNALVVPDADKASHDSAIKQGVQEGIASDKKGGWGTFIVLAFIFVFLQILGVLFGYKYGFAGEESELAYRAIGSGRYASYADVRAHYEEIRNAAQAMLAELQRRVMQIRDANTKENDKTFAAFLAERRYEATKDRENERIHAAARLELERQAVASVAPARSAEPAASNTAAQHTASSESSDAATLLVQLDAIADKEHKKAFIGGLTHEQQQAVTEALKLRKEAKARLDAELDGLL